MIIGHGDIAKALTDRPDVIFMASGVSNSKETSPNAFQREMNLLMSQPKDWHLVYFSSLCVYYGKTEYARHKRVMENTIKCHFAGYTIVRIGNIDWGNNPHTLINYFRNNPQAVARPCYRHIISLSEFKYWMSMIPVPGRTEMNIPGKMVYVPDLLESIRATNGVGSGKTDFTIADYINGVTPNNIDL